MIRLCFDIQRGSRLRRSVLPRPSSGCHHGRIVVALSSQRHHHLDVVCSSSLWGRSSRMLAELSLLNANIERVASLSDAA